MGYCICTVYIKVQDLLRWWYSLSELFGMYYKNDTIYWGQISLHICKTPSFQWRQSHCTGLPLNSLGFAQETLLWLNPGVTFRALRSQAGWGTIQLNYRQINQIKSLFLKVQRVKYKNTAAGMNLNSVKTDYNISSGYLRSYIRESTPQRL